MLLDLGPALKRGVDLKALQARLSGLLADAHNTSTPVVLRGRWFVQADPWTAHRAAMVIDEAAKTGKVPAAPLAPWFFATFKNTPNQSNGIATPIQPAGGADSERLRSGLDSEHRTAFSVEPFPTRPTSRPPP